MSKKLAILLLSSVFLLAAGSNPVLGAPSNPNPGDGAVLVPLHPILGWTPADGGPYQDVFFGTNPAGLAQVADNLYDYESSYDPGVLSPAQTYYWRVDSDFDGTVEEGPLWSFATDNGIAQNPSPGDGAENVSVDVVLSWPVSEIVLSHNVYFGTSPADLAFKGNYPLASNSYDPGGLLMGRVYFWRIDEITSLGTVTGNLWSLITEGFASNPKPSDTAQFWATDKILSWTPGIQSGTQDIYFGTTFNDVNNAFRPAGDIIINGVVDFEDMSAFTDQWLSDPAGDADLNFDNAVDLADFAMFANGWMSPANPAFMANQLWDTNDYDPTLTPGNTYYWRVDAIKGADRCKGDIWQFTVQGGTPAFPGAEGWGAHTLGGRGGQVIHVTNLNSSGPGSLAAACATAGPRIVVFDVSGVIRGQVNISQPYITIAGQTAPGAGITIVGMVRGSGNQHDVVIRHIRVRPPPEGGDQGDGFQLGGSGAYNVILDHCSVSWAIDETIDFYWGHDMTVQWCSVEESDPLGHPKGEGHNFGMISAAENSGAVSAHHNLWAHHYRRVPCMAPYRYNAACDFRNNLVYDCYGGLTHDGHEGNVRSPLNNFYNYWKRGPSSWNKIYPFATVTGPQYYIANNYFQDWGLKGHPAYWTYGTTPGWVQFNNIGAVITEPGDTPPITTHQITDQASAVALYNMVLAKAGAWPKDRVTLRTINETITGTGSYGRHADAYPTDEWFMDGLTPTTPPTDTDGDGMPDAWEMAHGLNHTNASDRNNIVPAGASAGDRHKGYTYIEFYINELAESLVP